MWKPLKIQGLGPGGIIGAHELQGRDPEDPRFNIKGSVIDGRFFQQNAPAFDADGGGPRAVRPGRLRRVPAPCSAAPTSPSSRRARRRTTSPSCRPVRTAPASTAARIDGLGLDDRARRGAGGIQLQASINNMQITNNVLENNGGVVAGGIGVGQPFVHGSHNYNVRIANDRLIGNGGLTHVRRRRDLLRLNNYEVANSIICSNFSVELRRRHLAHRAQPERQHPRQPDLLQRVGRLGRRASRSSRETRRIGGGARRRHRRRSTSTAT